MIRSVCKDWEKERKCNRGGERMGKGANRCSKAIKAEAALRACREDAALSELSA